MTDSLKAAALLEEAKRRFHYDSNTGLLTYKIRRPNRDIGSVAGWKTHQGYIELRINGTVYGAHRIIWLMNHGRMPDQIDHINGNRSDNRMCNLREVTIQENNRNKFLHREGRLVGAYFSKRMNRYKSLRTINDQQIYLGLFKTEREAHERYIWSLQYNDLASLTSALKSKLSKKREQVFLEYNGEKHHMAEWARRLNLDRTGLLYRLRHWTDKDKIFTPKQALAKAEKVMK